MSCKRIVAIIPARSGSKRVKHKNVRMVGGHPLIAYTIEHARNSGIFSEIFVCTDSQNYAEIATTYGATVPKLRPQEISGEHSPDIEWVTWCIKEWGLNAYDALSILRPTSPMRDDKDIKLAWKKFNSQGQFDSIRAVTPTHIHPGKMWTINGKTITPLMPFSLNNVPWHSCQTASLPEVFYQNASLEIAWISRILETGKISGDLTLPYFSEGYSSYDINEPIDMDFFEFLIQKEIVKLSQPQRFN